MDAENVPAQDNKGPLNRTCPLTCFSFSYDVVSPGLTALIPHDLRTPISHHYRSSVDRKT